MFILVFVFTILSIWLSIQDQFYYDSTNVIQPIWEETPLSKPVNIFSGGKGRAYLREEDATI